MTLRLSAPDPRAESETTYPVVFVIQSDTALRGTLDSVALGAHWRTETVPSVSALHRRQRRVAPSCLVLDVSRSDCEDFPSRAWPMDMPVICVTGVGDVSLCVRAMKAGAVDVLTKPVGSGPLLEAVRMALNRSEAGLREEIALREMRRRYASLSPRQREVMTMVASGMMNKHIARELAISEVTVKAHRGCMMAKMKCRSLAHLVVVAARLQLTHREPLTPSARPEAPPPHRTDEPESAGSRALPSTACCH